MWTELLKILIEVTGNAEEAIRIGTLFISLAAFSIPLLLVWTIHVKWVEKHHIPLTIAAVIFAVSVGFLAYTGLSFTQPSQPQPKYNGPRPSLEYICIDDGDYLKLRAPELYNKWCIPRQKYNEDYQYWLKHGEVPK